MKQMKMILVGTAFCILCLSATLAFAAPVNNPATSTGKLEFADYGATAPVNPDSPEMNLPLQGTGQKGPLSLDYVPANISFGTANTNPGRAFVYNQIITNMSDDPAFDAPFIQVTDYRTTRAGWSLLVRAGAFTNSDGTKTIKGVLLKIEAGNPNASDQDKLSSGNNTPTAYAVSLDCADTSTPRLIFDSGSTNTGLIGTWVNRMYDPGQANTTALTATNPLSNSGVSLRVPAGQTEANVQYTSTISWILEDTPSGD